MEKLYSEKNQLESEKKEIETKYNNLILKYNELKNQIIKMIQRFFPDIPSLGHDSADALAVAICHSMQSRSKIKSFL